jgi:hypothetical protein
MSGITFNTDFSSIKPNMPGGAAFPISNPRMGWLCKIVDSTTKENKNKDGVLAVFTLEGMEGEVMGVQHTLNINIANPSQQAVDIGKAEISAIAHCIGHLRVGSSLELHGKPFRVLVRQQKNDERYVEIFGFQDVNGNDPAKAGSGPMKAEPAAAAAAAGFAPTKAAEAPAQTAAAEWGTGAAAEAEPAKAAVAEPAWGANAGGADTGAAADKPAWA